jgi:galactokinase
VNLKYKREDRWANYLKVAIHIFAELGYPAKGLNFTLLGDVPQHVGLASSSAIETAASFALKGFLEANISDRDLLFRLAASKTQFFGNVRSNGTNHSLVDYLIAFSAKKDQFLVIDETSLKARRIKTPLNKYKLIIMDSRVPRIGIDEELRQRQEDIKKGLDLLSGKKQKSSFKDFAATDLVESMGNLPEEIRRRSLHVVQEIRRVNDVDLSLRRGDFSSFTKIINHSHESLRDLYEVSCPEIDWLVKRAQELDGVLASRMTGSGFGGCTYTFIREDIVDEYKKRLEDYERIFGFRPVIYEMNLASGARLVTETNRENTGKKRPLPETNLRHKLTETTQSSVHRVADKKIAKRSLAR